MYKIACMPGDGIGPEIMTQSLKVLEIVAKSAKVKYELEEMLVGGAGFDACGEHLSDSCVEKARDCHAILFGSVGGPVTESHLPKWDGCERNTLLKLRAEMGFFANLRPIRVSEHLAFLSPVKIKNPCNILIFRELLSGLYYGERHSGVENGVAYATDVCYYNEEQIKRIVQTACETAVKLKEAKVSVVHKANVLQTSKLWQKVAREVIKKFNLEIEEILVDNCAMQLVINPSAYRILVTENMFGDILSDLASALPGSLGLTPSASFGDSGIHMYEPAGGSAPDIANQNIANPTAQIMCVGLLFEHTFGMPEVNTGILNAIDETMKQGYFTPDIARHVEGNVSSVSTSEFTNQVIKNL